MEATEFKSMQALDANREGPELTDRERHLIGMAVTATRGCAVCTGSRMERAAESGISYETLCATIDLAAAVNAGVVLRTAVDGADKYDIDRLCTGPECSV